MKTVGIIAEFNPFHAGHAYLIQKARELTGADYVIVVMSGNYVQRGTPAIMPKGLRTKCALLNGADLIFELPVYAATASAEFFALGAVRMLNDLGIDFLCFGSECGNLDALSLLASFLSEESSEYQSHLKTFLKEGNSFPAARRKAVSLCLGESAAYLDSPNNLLAIEYLKAIQKTHSKIRPVTVKRQGAGYHETSLFRGITPSAGAIRAAITESAQCEAFSDLLPFITEAGVKLFEQEWQKSFPVLEDDFSLLLSYALHTKSDEAIGQISDMSRDLAASLRKMRYEHISFRPLAEKLKTKNLTYTRICRALLHLILNLTIEDAEKFFANSVTPYLRLLGFREPASAFLKQERIKQLPIITKPAKAAQLLSESVCPLFEKELLSSELYREAAYHKFHADTPSDFTHEIILVK